MCTLLSVSLGCAHIYTTKVLCLKIFITAVFIVLATSVLKRNV